MNRSVIALMMTLAAAVPAGAEGVPADTDGGFSLIEEGSRLILRHMLDQMKPAMDEAQKGMAEALAEWGPAMRDLAGRVGDLSAYHAPEMLPNGDIIIRRKRAAEPGVVGPGGDMEL